MAMSIVRILMAAMAMAAVVDLAMAANYDVGDKSGWTLGVDYAKWVADKKFVPGDNITFTYSSDFHDVEEVTAADYAACSLSDPIGTYETGRTLITLDSVGKRYFLCGAGDHCEEGMKIEIDVVAASESPSPSSSPAGGPSSSSGNPASPSSAPAPSAAARSNYTAAFGLVM